MTFTASWNRDEIVLNPPVGRYLAMMATGLREAHGFDDDAVVAYLWDRPGLRPAWTREALAAAIASSPAP